VDVGRSLNDAERAELEELLQIRDPDGTGPMRGSLSHLHGFLAAAISGPVLAPSEWIAPTFGDDDEGWNSEEAQRAMNLLMRFYNDTCSALAGEGHGFRIVADYLGEGADEVAFVDGWCLGYLKGMVLRVEEWKRATSSPELAEAFSTIVLLAESGDDDIDPIEDSKTYRVLLDELPTSVVEIYDWWRRKLHPGPVRRSAPKVPPNDRCPCGSGKKYKRCCSPLHAL
jgi:uncharacterized protein